MKMVDELQLTVKEVLDFEHAEILRRKAFLEFDEADAVRLRRLLEHPRRGQQARRARDPGRVAEDVAVVSADIEVLLATLDEGCSEPLGNQPGDGDEAVAIPDRRLADL